MTQYRIKHEGDVIGYAFAKDAETALRAFRNKHGIPAEINLTAERV